MGRRLAVTKFDQRGDDLAPFGFIEFNDDTRLGYTPGIEKTAPDTVQIQGLWPANWSGNTPQHFHVADRWLFDNFPPHRQFYPAKPQPNPSNS